MKCPNCGASFELDEETRKLLSFASPDARIAGTGTCPKCGASVSMGADSSSSSFRENVMKMGSYGLDTPAPSSASTDWSTILKYIIGGLAIVLMVGGFFIYRLHFSDFAITSKLEDLRDPDPAVRSAALEKLAARNEGSDAVARVFVSQLSKPDYAVVPVMYPSLVALKDPHLLQALTTEVGSSSCYNGFDNERKCERIVEILGHIPDERSTRALVSLMNDSLLGDKATEALIATGELAYPSLIEAVRETPGDEFVQEDVSRILARSFNPNSEVLLGALHDPEVAVRSTVAVPYFMLLTKIPRIQRDPVVHLLEDEDPDLRTQALELFVRYRDPIAVAPIVAMLENDDPILDDESRRRDAVWFLAAMGDPLAADVLIAHLSPGNTEVIKALGKMGDQKAVEPLLLLLPEESLIGREAIIAALCKIPDPFIEEKLHKILKKSDIPAHEQETMLEQVREAELQFRDR